MRYRVDTQFGYSSFDESDKEKVYELYRQKGSIRLLLCRDIYDEGTLIEGRPVFVDLTGQAS